MENVNGVMPIYDLADINKNRDGAGEWIWMFMFFVLFGYGNNRGGQGVTADYLLNQTSRITEQVLTSANRLGNGISDATYALNNAINGVGSKVESCCCNSRYESAQNFGNMKYDMAQGFCGVNRNIDNLRYDMAEKFCQVYHNQATDKAEILQAIHNTSCQEQIRELERENAALSQRNQTTTILAAVQDLLKQYSPLSI